LNGDGRMNVGGVAGKDGLVFWMARACHPLFLVRVCPLVCLACTCLVSLFLSCVNNMSVLSFSVYLSTRALLACPFFSSYVIVSHSGNRIQGASAEGGGIGSQTLRSGWCSPIGFDTLLAATLETQAAAAGGEEAEREHEPVAHSGESPLSTLI
jgi:hypothetical protein